jgi:hypothetical protein
MEATGAKGESANKAKFGSDEAKLLKREIPPRIYFFIEDSSVMSAIASS